MFQILIIIITFSILIILHELGHFLMARKFGVRVEEFGLGLPPRLWGKKIGETLFSLNAIPFGGFVRMFGEEENIKESQSFSGKPIWQRALIVVAGVVVFWIIAFILLSVVLGLGALVAVGDGEVVGAYSWYQAPIKGFLVTGSLTRSIVEGFGQIIGLAIQGEPMPAGVKVLGPVGIFDFMGDRLDMGMVYFLHFIAIIVIHLAIINLLPIPALDGGKLVFLGIEAIRGKPISQKVEQNITAFFFLLLISLMIFITIQDIGRIF